MIFQWIPENRISNSTYDGTQLRSLYAYLNFDLLGPSIIAWRGSCDIPLEHMIDGEDLRQKAVIKGNEMLHFIIEVFDQSLFSAVWMQRAFARIVKSELEKLCPHLLVIQEGDDLYLQESQSENQVTISPPQKIRTAPSEQPQEILKKVDPLSRKLSISIATCSGVSVLIHFAINITNQGTPIPTASLGDDFGIYNISEFATSCMKSWKEEFQSVLFATQKVRSVR